jgi:hypothetical protein
MSHFSDVRGYSYQGSGLLVIRHNGHASDDGRGQLKMLSSFPHDRNGKSRF